VRSLILFGNPAGRKRLGRAWRHLALSFVFFTKKEFDPGERVYERNH
jgi:hypothetical protein